jgi:hypothetical protein
MSSLVHGWILNEIRKVRREHLEEYEEILRAMEKTSKTGVAA